jgi:hypothetical protein
MSNYESVVEAVLTKGSITIKTTVSYSSLRRGINKVIEAINDSAELMEQEESKLKGDITIKLLSQSKIAKTYEIVYYPEGRPLPDCFQSKFEFNIVEESDENSS